MPYSRLPKLPSWAVQAKLVDTYSAAICHIDVEDPGISLQ